MPITFKAKGITLRDALHSMLEPRGLTVVIADGGAVVITTKRAAQKPEPALWPPKLRYRLRFRGKLVVIAPFVGPVVPDSGAGGYAVPKGAKVAFVTERVANAMDAGYTLMVLLTAGAVIAFPKWRRRGFSLRPSA
jgi:hypothetical protein